MRAARGNRVMGKAAWSQQTQELLLTGHMAAGRWTSANGRQGGSSRQGTSSPSTGPGPTQEQLGASSQALLSLTPGSLHRRTVTMPFPGRPHHCHQYLKRLWELTCVGSTSPWMMLRMAM